MADRITVQGIEIPVPKDRELTDFLTPDWSEVVDFYPEYCKLILGDENERKEPYDPQPYLLEVAHELGRLKVREGRDQDAWMQRLMEHYGIGWLMNATGKMTGAKREAMDGK